jgi:hypothetical protein
VPPAATVAGGAASGRLAVRDGATGPRGRTPGRRTAGRGQKRGRAKAEVFHADMMIQRPGLGASCWLLIVGCGLSLREGRGLSSPADDGGCWASRACYSEAAALEDLGPDRIGFDGRQRSTTGACSAGLPGETVEPKGEPPLRKQIPRGVHHERSEWAWNDLGRECPSILTGAAGKPDLVGAFHLVLGIFQGWNAPTASSHQKTASPLTSFFRSSPPARMDPACPS